MTQGQLGSVGPTPFTPWLSVAGAQCSSSSEGSGELDWWPIGRTTGRATRYLEEFKEGLIS